MKSKYSSKERTSLFYLYLLLFCITAFTPVVICSFSIYLSFVELEQEITHSNQAALQLIQQSFDSKIQELENTRLVLDTDPALTQYSLTTDQLESIQTLADVTLLHDSLDSIIVKVKEDDYFYSSNGCYSISDLKYQNHIMHLESMGYSSSEWVKLANTCTTPTYWPVNAITSAPNFLYLFAPMTGAFRSSGINSTRTVIMLINQDFIHELFRSSQTVDMESILLLDADMNLLSYLAPNSSPETITTVCNYLKNHLSLYDGVSNEYIELEDSNNLLFISFSPKTGLYYVRFLPKSIAYGTLYDTSLKIVVILLFVVLTAILLIITGLRRSYNPIRTLANWIHESQPRSSQINHELIFIKNAFDDAFSKNLSLSRTIDNSKYGLINYFLSCLICGTFQTESDFQTTCKDLGISLNKKYWLVCSIRIEEPAEMSTSQISFDSILSILNADLPRDVHLQVKDLLIENKLLLVFNSNSDSTSFYQTIVANIKTRLYSQANLLTSIGIGCIYDSYEQVGKSYLECTNALDYRLIYGKNRIISPDMYTNHISYFSYPSATMDQLQSALKAHNTEEILDSIKAVHDYTKSETCSLHSAKYVCYDVLTALKRFQYLSDIKSDNELNITHLIAFESVDDFFCSLSEILVNAMGSPLPSTDSEMVQKFIAYINDHCFEYNFQIQNMASHFSITPQHMRKLFVSQTGTKISDYVSTLKIEKAKQLLRETDLNLHSIVIEIGNSDTSGFVRSFKNKTGMTPGEYRKQHNSTE